jgi:CBS domain-containing protein
MRIEDVLRHKGAEVVTVVPEATVESLLALLEEHKIGAAVVSEDGTRVRGIVSERDIVRALAARGSDLLGEPVRSIMTTEVVCVSPEEAIDHLMEIMTNKRFRHVPILDSDSRLMGIVSIGDVVKSRLAELQTERDSLATYVETATT